MLISHLPSSPPVTGVSGPGKSTFVSGVLVDLVAEYLGQPAMSEEEEVGDLELVPVKTGGGEIALGAEHIRPLVVVDPNPIGRTPRSNLAM